MKKFILLVIAITVLCSVSYGQEIRWVTLDDIAKSLQDQKPMTVGFDIDDTVLFSSPGFYYGKQKYSPENYDFLKKQEFWHDMNNGWDRFSIPKECAKKLIEFHKTRGDKIIFITARTATKTETVTETLKKVFSLQETLVVFTGVSKEKNLKVQPIVEHQVKLYYGDSDSDITAAQEAQIRAIRIIRAKNSTHKPLPKNGELGEEVLVDSDF